MSIGRTILALLVALSVALLPAAAGAGVSVKSPAQADMSAMEDMHDCCPKANPCDKAMDDCGTMATCALKCFSFAATSSSNHRIPRDLCEDDGFHLPPIHSRRRWAVRPSDLLASDISLKTQRHA